MSVDAKIAQFLESEAFAVAGVSKKPDKFGYKVFKCYQQKGHRVIPVHPVEKAIDNVPCVASVAELPDDVVSLSVVTPPAVTEKLVMVAAEKGIRNIWMQPGAQSPAAIAFCEQNGINVIADGTCVLVRFGCKH
ncbi:MAG: CoA-binding protein [Pelovirga sp.]